MCRYTSNLDMLIEHYCLLVNFLAYIEQSNQVGEKDFEMERDFWSYFEQTGTSSYVLEIITAIDKNNSTDLLKGLAEFYQRNGDAKTAVRLQDKVKNGQLE